MEKMMTRYEAKAAKTDASVEKGVMPLTYV